MNTELSVEIDRPIEQVFEQTLGHVPGWSLTCVREEVHGEEKGVGTKLEIVTRERGREMRFEGTVTKHEPPNASALTLRGDYFDIDVDYRFEDLAGRTRVTQRSQVHGKGLTKVLFVLFGWLMKRAGCKAQEAELASLKAFCEGQPPA